MNKRKSKQLITTLGTLATIGAFFLAYYVFYSQKEEKLVATGVYMDFKLPNKYEKVYLNFVNSIPNDIGLKLTASSFRSSEENQKLRNSIVDSIYMTTQPLKDMISFTENLSQLVKIDVKNDGLKQADNVTLELNGQGLYQVGNDPTIRSYNESIPIGTVRPSTTITVYLWEDRLSYLRDRKVTYTNGAEPIIFKQDVIEYPFWLTSLFYVGILLLFFTPVLLFGVYLGQTGKIPLLKVVSEPATQHNEPIQENIEIPKSEEPKNDNKKPTRQPRKKQTDSQKTAPE